MNSKLLPFAAGLIAGVLLASMVLLNRNRQRDAETARVATATQALAIESGKQAAVLNEQLVRAKARTQKLESDNLQLATKVQDLMKQVDAAPKPKASKNPLMAMFGGDDAGDTNGAGSAMRQMMKAAMEQQMEGKISRMKSRLNLTPEQEKAAREILGRANSRGQEVAEQVLKGGSKPSDVAQNFGNPETELKALLSPEQKAGYEQLQQEEVTNNARLIANSELLQMQQSLNLDQAQQDKVFAVLFEQSRSQLAGAQPGASPDAAANPLKSLDDVMQHKLEALKGVLTDEQMESYRKVQEQQMKLIQSFLPKEGKPGDVAVPQIQILPKP